MEKTTACYMCDNARTNPELDSDNDLSYVCVGECISSYRMFIRSGDGKSTVILIDKWSEERGWFTIPVGVYKPQYCPNCGRRLKENDVTPE